MKNCLIVDDVEYTFEEVSSYVMQTFDSTTDEWYAPINSMTANAFEDIVKSLKKRDTSVLAWRSEVMKGVTLLSYNEWKGT